MRSAEAFFNWAFRSRAQMMIRLLQGEKIPEEQLFLSFCSHTPVFISHGPAGLNGSVKGVGFLPKPEYLEETLDAFMQHIKSYDGDDEAYRKQGLSLLVKYLYRPEVHDRIDFTRLGSLEMAKKHSWNNYLINPEATLIFYQPPVISYELRGTMEIYDEARSGKRELYQQFINALHDMYHRPDIHRWRARPAYVFIIREVWDNCVSKDGFGTQMRYPY